MIYTLETPVPKKWVFLIEYLKDRLLDPEEKVRAVACRVIGEMNLDHIIDHVDIKLLQEIAARCKDKKVKYYEVGSMGILSNVSLVICTQSSHVYPWFALPCSLSQNVGVKSNNAYSCVTHSTLDGSSSSQENDESAVSKLGWIPESVLYCVYVDDVSVT